MATDSFTRKRILKVIEEHRSRHGQLPTYLDLERAGFSRETIKTAARDGIIEELFVTLTNGTVVKGFKAKH